MGKVERISKEEIGKIRDNNDLSKSKRMIELYLGGLEIKEISVEMGVRYNFVYNVLSNYCRMNDLELRRVKRNSKKDDIVRMIDEGMNNVEISSELKCSYNYVYGVRKEKERIESKVKSK